MADQETDVMIDDVADDEPRGRGALLGLLAVASFILTVVLVECAVAYLVFPSADDLVVMVQAEQAAQSPKTEIPEDELEGESKQDHVDRTEVDLGQFAVTSYQPLSNTTLRIDFQLFGLVLADDAGEFEQLLEEHRYRFREQVLMILRSSEMTDLTDAGLGLIKRKILEKTNHTLGKALLQEVVVSDFSFLEQ